MPKTYESFRILPLIPLDMFRAECRGADNSGHMDFVHGGDEKIAQRFWEHAETHGCSERMRADHLNMLLRTFFLNNMALVNHQEIRKNHTPFEVCNLSMGSRVVVYIYMCTHTHTHTCGPVLIGTYIFACWVFGHFLGMQ